jgi:hypothetical protein
LRQEEDAQLYLSLYSSNLDPNLQKGNGSRKYAVDRLTEGFYALGGKAWQERRESEHEVPDKDEASIIFANLTNTMDMGACTPKEIPVFLTKLRHKRSTIPISQREEQNESLGREEK